MDKYEKIQVVGRGASSTVYLCCRVTDRKLVIIKQIPVEQMTKEERQAALNEGRVLAMLHHPNIIEYYENFLQDKALMIVMEYAPGGTLYEYLQQRGDHLLDEEEILHLFAQILLSLHHVHSRQILHRDLKTQNILLNKRKDVVKIGDFGISKILSSKSKAYTVVGTPCYISPELCEGKPYNQKSDIWALGCVLYELITLKRAFEATTLPALILKIMRGTFAPIAEHYSDGLKQLLLSMLHLDPNKRPNINEIMAQSIVVNSLYNLYTDIGKIPCVSRPQRPPTLPGSRAGCFSRCDSTKEGSGLDLYMKDHTSRIKPVGQSLVFCWGAGIETPIKLPDISADTTIIQVAVGRTQRMAVTKNGRVITWETLDVGTEHLPGSIEGSSITFVPRYLEAQSAVTIVQVACGDLFNAFLTDRGILLTFGSGANGCLGHGNYSDVSQAKIVESLLGFEVVMVSCGASHVMAVTNEHELFSWGRGDNGRLGLSNQESYCVPQLVPIDEQFKPKSVFCGLDCSLLLTMDKKFLACGNNRYNKLCLDSSNDDDHINTIDEISLFTPVFCKSWFYTPIKTVALGTSHTAILLENGDLYTSGNNKFGQLGRKVESKLRSPGKIEVLQNEKISEVACGDSFTVVVADSGVFSWGNNSRGRLGHSSESELLVNLGSAETLIPISLSCSNGSTLLLAKSK